MPLRELQGQRDNGIAQARTVTGITKYYDLKQEATHIFSYMFVEQINPVPVSRTMELPLYGRTSQAALVKYDSSDKEI